jgi:beta-lactamase superfamily II metal-dependent hydrolase
MPRRATPTRATPTRATPTRATPRRATSRRAATREAGAEPREAGKRLLPPKDGATVRMYRTGHGDCFLLAFAGADPGKPAYVLIDCGYKPGSPKFIDTKIAEITKSIREATGGHVDVAVITHEHQDHVNGITAANFKDFTIGETWLAWTEDPKDRVANKLREAFKDKLLGLLAARNRLAAAGETEQAKQIDDFLAFELGGEDEVFDAPAAAALLGAAGGDPAQSMNKRSMKVWKDLAENGVRYIRPHEEILVIPGAKDVRVFALGPPRDPDQLEDLDPQGDEQFHLALATASPGNYFAAALAAPEAHGRSPFAGRYALGQDVAYQDPGLGEYFTLHYGQDGTPPAFDPATGPCGEDEAPDNPDWRRIDKEWLYSAERLALDMNNSTNNASLVLAFELGKGGKVLLFAADAQRGNWVSWAEKDWKDGDRKVTAKDLLARTVLYKVGHHGSHNATLNGLASGEHASLGWMAQGDHGREFTAMITAVRAWAETQKGWDHPLKAIKDALLEKASGRVFQTDTDLDQMKIPDGASAADWKRFQSRATGDRLYFDYTVKS